MYSDEDEYSPTKAELIFALLKESILSSLVSLWDHNNCKLYLMLLFMCFLLTLLTLGSLLKIFFPLLCFWLKLYKSLSFNISLQQKNCKFSTYKSSALAVPMYPSEFVCPQDLTVELVPKGSFHIGLLRNEIQILHQRNWGNLKELEEHFCPGALSDIAVGYLLLLLNRQEIQKNWRWKINRSENSFEIYNWKDPKRKD